ncbi:MAG: phosphoribosylformimino-5-aminoimidazole carboxamide ribotide isomerase [Lachnospiraceae bacterium]|nr:phosphoribosylformimino-5-aminoimidazole carboxamide ribotide isomerase [Lachnospiraceae bacterium]
MRLRPCIDIHNGSVKQIVGSSLNDTDKNVKENFVSGNDAAYYALLYKEEGLSDGHIIILNSKDSPGYADSKDESLRALQAFPGGMGLGGGIDPQNAIEFIKAGASHVIVTSYVFKDGKIDDNALMRMVDSVGKDHLILDLSCKRRDDGYYVATDRWQKVSDVKIEGNLLSELSKHCDEFLVHAADVEGKRAGIEKDLLPILKESPIPVTYAGGVHDLGDIDLIKRSGEGRIDVTIGSALKIFGGNLDLLEAANFCKA